MLSIQKIQQITSSEVLQLPNPEQLIEHLLTDSRRLIKSDSTLFFAIKGTRHDGHHYIKDLYQQGVRNFIIEAEYTLSDLPNANLIKVKNSIEALQEIAKFRRQSYDYPIIGITGSYGKTIVKEWLNQMLSKNLKIIKTPKSYNSQIGVALSLWEMNAKHQLAIIEAGISETNEMSRLAQIISPTYGILTNIGQEHKEGFEDITQKLSEKLTLFASCKKVIINDQLYQNYKQLFEEITLFRWGQAPDCNLCIAELIPKHNHTLMIAKYKGKEIQLEIPFKDDFSIQNCLHCISYLLIDHYTTEDIQQQISDLKQVSTRLELKKGIKHNYIIDDTYNNDLGGLKIALDFLQNQQQGESKTLILSDLFEQGIQEETLYHKIAQLIKEKGVHKLVAIGEKLLKFRSLFHPLESYFYPDTNTFLQQIIEPNFKDEMILVKGAKAYGFQKIIDRLQYKAHRTVFEINLDALVHNLNYYKSLLDQKTKIMVMVKAFAYGSGATEVANLLQFNRVDYLAVAYADEGVQLREEGIELPIMIMNPDEDAFHNIITHRLEPEIYSFRMLDLWERFIDNFIQEEPLNIHIKIDTGMRRLGFTQEDLPNLSNRLSQNSKIKVVSIMSHLAGADGKEHEAFTLQQIKRFKECCTILDKALGYTTIKHILNSSGIVRYPTQHMDMVRLGIGLYGAEPNRKKQAELKTIGRLKTNISQIKSVKAGETVGYSRKGKVNKDTKIATIAVGYADGLSRAFSNGVGKVKVKGKICPIIGNICMDMTMIDIGDLQVEEGEEVIIFDEDHDIWTLADSIDTIPYEILTSISERVKRVYFTP